MGHFTDSGHPAAEVESQADIERGTRLGLYLFAAYCLFYFGFMLLHAFVPSVVDIVLPGGLNLATALGLGLIIGAFVLALLYAWLCRKPARQPG